MKNLLNFGKALKKADQKRVFGGRKNGFQNPDSCSVVCNTGVVIYNVQECSGGHWACATEGGYSGQCSCPN